MEISAKEFGLNSRIKLTQTDTKHITIVKQIKSRIITKDAIKIIEIATKIRKQKPDNMVSLLCHRNICSKSIKLLEQHKIDIIYTEL